MLEAVEVTAKLTNQKIDDILIQMDATYKYTQGTLKWYSLELNQALFSQPYIKQKQIGIITSTKSRTTLTKYLSQLVKLGILSPKTEGREVYYINDDLIRILQS